MDEQLLEEIYRENLEERLIAHLAQRCGFTLEKAMDVYYHSSLAGKIHQGTEGVQYLDHKVLVDILLETEPVRQTPTAGETQG